MMAVVTTTTPFDFLPENVIELICERYLTAEPRDLINFLVYLNSSPQCQRHLTRRPAQRKKCLDLRTLDEGVCKNAALQHFIRLDEHIILRSPRQLYEFRQTLFRPLFSNLHTLIINDEPLDTWANFPLVIPQLKHLKVKLTHAAYMNRQQQQHQKEQHQHQHQLKHKLNTHLLNFAADSLRSLDLTLVHDSGEEEEENSVSYQLDLNNLLQCKELRLTIPCRHRLMISKNEYVVMAKSVERCLIWIVPDSRVKSVDLTKCPNLFRLALLPLRCVGEIYKSKKIFRTSAVTSCLYDRFIHSVKRYKTYACSEKYNDDAISDSPYHESKKRRQFLPWSTNNLTTFFVAKRPPLIMTVYFYYNQLNDYNRYRVHNNDCPTTFMRVLYNGLHHAMHKLTALGFYKYG